MEVIVGDTEPIENAVQRFRRKVIRSGLFKELRERRFYEKPSERRRRKRAEAIRRCKQAAAAPPTDWLP